LQQKRQFGWRGQFAQLYRALQLHPFLRATLPAQPSESGGKNEEEEKKQKAGKCKPCSHAPVPPERSDFATHINTIEMKGCQQEDRKATDLVALLLEVRVHNMVVIHRARFAKWLKKHSGENLMKRILTSGWQYFALQFATGHCVPR
jgi:hypothetical protein